MNRKTGRRVRRWRGRGRPINRRLFLPTAAAVLLLVGTRLFLDMAWPMDKPNTPTASVSEQGGNGVQPTIQPVQPQKEPQEVEKPEPEPEKPRPEAKPQKPEYTQLPKESQEPEKPPMPEKPKPQKKPEKELSQKEKLKRIRTSAEYPKVLVNLAEHYKEMVDYVYYYPERKDERPVIDLSAEAKADKVPLLMQWDERWGYVPYSSGMIGTAGCGPVCLSMAALYLTHNPVWTPVKVAELAEREGYSVKEQGSSWTLMSEGSSLMGMKAEELPLNRNLMVQALDEGKLIILAVGPGDFTRSGHYLVVTGYEEEGFHIHDPNSRANSEKIWGYQQLERQIRNLWAMSKA